MPSASGLALPLLANLRRTSDWGCARVWRRGVDGELKQVGMRNTHMTAKLIVGLNHKLECKMVERVAMRQLAHRLSTLVLEDCCIQDDDLGYIAAGLCRVIGSDTVCKLRCLSLTNNFISAKGGQSLGKALRVSTTLRHLYLDWNNLGAEGCRHLSEALRHNRHLELLHLEANDVRDQGIVELAAALGTNSSLTDVNLATNNITASGGAALARMLHANDALVSLCLNGNSIGGQGGCQVAEALGGGNSRLERLALDSSDLPAECFEALAKSLRTAACRLQHLSASANACGDQGARALAYSLSSNTRLRTLRLAGAGISRDCVAAIIDVAASVGRLEELDLRGNAGVALLLYRLPLAPSSCPRRTLAACVPRALSRAPCREQAWSKVCISRSDTKARAARIDSVPVVLMQAHVVRARGPPPRELKVSFYFTLE